MMKTSGRERRIHLRAKRVLSIEFRLSSPKRKNADTTWHLSTTQDMSLGGIAFFSDVEFRVADILEVRVVMSGILDVFKGLVKIVRVEQRSAHSYYLVAVKFVNVKSRSARRISSVSKKKVSRLK
jgi:c-di-GMP-binding flagellar brake protein YcgR